MIEVELYYQRAKQFDYLLHVANRGIANPLKKIFCLDNFFVLL